MRGFERFVLPGLAALLSFSSFTHAEPPAASTFYLDDTQTAFSLNVANDSSDVSIFFTSPAYSWVAVGFGAQMKDSLMFVMYPSNSGNNVTVSPRLATGHAEPSYEPSVDLQVLPSTTVNDSMLVLNAVCHNCRVWRNGFLDVKSNSQPMIYAFGNGHRLQSDSLDAPLERHQEYGHFTMDMLAATGPSGIPANTTQSNGVQMQGGMTRDHDYANMIHAVMGCFALFVLWPLNVVLAGFIKRMGIHIGLSAFIMIFLIISYALGIASSSEYNRSKSMSSPHQIMAFVSLPLLLTMCLLPIPSISRLSPVIPKIHTPLTSITLTFLILTGGLGLHLSSSVTAIKLVYTAVSLAVFLILAMLQTCIWRRGSAYARANPHSHAHRRTRSRRNHPEEDEQDLVLAAYYAGRKLDDESRSTSAASMHRPSNASSNGHGSGAGGSWQSNDKALKNLGITNSSGASSHSRNGSGDSGNSDRSAMGGGSMPGPQYLLNMHPGVPVTRW